MVNTLKSDKYTHFSIKKAKSVTAYSQELNAYTRELKAYSQESAAYSQESNAYTRELAAYSQELNAYTRELKAYSQESAAYSWELKAYSQELNAYSPESVAYRQESHIYIHYLITKNQKNMKSRQSAKLNMYHTVDNCLTANTLLVATVPALVTAHTQLQDLIQQIEVKAETQQTADDGALEDKTEKQETLCLLASDTAGLIRAWAVATGETLIAEQMKVTKSGLEKMKDSLLAEHCNTILNTATTNLVALAPYGVTAGSNTQLQTAITDYETRSTAPRDAKVIISAATTDMDDLIKDADELLKLRVDKLVNPFSTNNAEFFNQYKEARVIIDAATSHSKATGIITNSGTGLPVSGVLAEVVGQSYTATSGLDGKYNLLIPVNGIYNIKFSKADYIDKTVNNVLITLGNSTTVDVTLTPNPA